MTELDAVIVCVLQGRATLEDQQRVRVWRKEHPDHEAHYRSLESLWALTGAVAPGYGGEVPFDQVMEAALEEAEASSAHHSIGAAVAGRASTTRVARERSGRRRVAIGLLAAGIAAIALGVGVFQRMGPGSGLLSEGAIATGPGEMTTITLSDASSIRLAPNSRLRLSETRDLRIAYLEGRGFFGIHSDPDRPFVVYTDHGRARVLGTRFEVNANDEEFTVLVVEGSVAVSAGGVDVDVPAGQMTISEAGSQPVAISVSDVYERLDWIGNAVVFQATPLRDAIQEIENRFSINVDLSDPELEDVLVTAAFSGESVSGLLNVVCEVINAVCLFDGTQVRIEAS